MTRTCYTAHYTLDDGTWLVEMEQIPQVHSFGRTLARAQANIRDALGLWLQVDDPAALQIQDDFTGLPRDVLEAIAEANEARRRAAQLATRAQQLTAETAQRLVRDFGVTTRDAARLLHVSHQRIHQLVRGQPRPT